MFKFFGLKIYFYITYVNMENNQKIYKSSEAQREASRRYRLKMKDTEEYKQINNDKSKRYVLNNSEKYYEFQKEWHKQLHQKRKQQEMKDNFLNKETTIYLPVKLWWKYFLKFLWIETLKNSLKFFWQKMVKKNARQKKVSRRIFVAAKFFVITMFQVVLSRALLSPCFKLFTPVLSCCHSRFYTFDFCLRELRWRTLPLRTIFVRANRLVYSYRKVAYLSETCVCLLLRLRRVRELAPFSSSCVKILLMPTLRACPHGEATGWLSCGKTWARKGEGDGP